MGLLHTARDQGGYRELDQHNRKTIDPGSFPCLAPVWALMYKLFEAISPGPVTVQFK